MTGTAHNPRRNLAARLLAATLVSFCLLVGAANATGRSERIARAHCREGMVVSCIHRASLHYHVSYVLLKRIAWCESRDSPRAHNPSGATGLFQILYPSTWSTTPWRRESPWSAKYNALAAAYMIARGRRGEWVC